MTTALIFGPQDMEVGDLSEWTASTGAVSASTTTPITGTYSLRGVAAGGEGRVDMSDQRPAGGGMQGIYAKSNYRPKITPVTANIAIMTFGGGTIGCYRNTDGKLFLSNDGAAQLAVQATAPTNGTVYAIELWAQYGGKQAVLTAGHPLLLRLWQDRVLEASATFSGGARQTNHALFFGTAAKATWDEEIDDVEVYSTPSFN